MADNARWCPLLVVLAMGACTSIPTFVPHMVPDMDTRHKHVVRLADAHGPLSAQRSATILARLAAHGFDTSIFDKHLALVAGIADDALTIGNRVDLLIDGPATYASMFAAIKAAQTNVNFETFIIEDDEIGRRFVSLLVEKQNQGLQVNFVYDSVGCLNTPRAFFTPLIASGVNVLEFNPINPLLARHEWELNRRDHRKLLVVDGKVAFVGGINISSVYSSGSFSTFSSSRKRQGWRDTHVRMEGPVVGDFQRLFMATWTEQGGPSLNRDEYFPALSPEGDEVVRAMGSLPGDDVNQIYVTLLSAINSAETQVFLTNAYFVPDPQLLTALEQAAARGVDVRLLLPNMTDSALVYYASRSFYSQLLHAGIKIYERHDAFLHAKTALVDGVWSTVGSTNLDWRSFVHNQEINAVMLGQKFGTQMAAMFDRDLASSRQVTLADWRKRPIKSRLKEIGARLWARLL